MTETPRAIAEDIVLTYGGSVGLMDAIIDAIMAERERAAKIAENLCEGGALQPAGFGLFKKAVATAIRTHTEK